MTVFSAALYNAQQGYQAILSAWQACKPVLLAGQRLCISIKPETRTTAQNRLLFSILTDLSEQCEWVINGKLTKADKEDVKDILSASLRQQQRMAQGLDGGLVVLGMRTSKLTVPEMSDLIALGHAVGDERGVQWSRTSLGRDVPDEVLSEA